jgi:hypothetical protein
MYLKWSSYITVNIQSSHYKSQLVNTVWENNYCLFSKAYKTLCGQYSIAAACYCNLFLSFFLSSLIYMYIYISLHVLNKTLKIIFFVPIITATWLTLRLFIQEVLGSNLCPETNYSEVLCGFPQSFQALPV